ncbi:type II secretion system F family protein [Glaciibacter sp. 2TAF33]|uniref:type II secretion system F family protein n=1 Tax=Glaciibacter sp. 2TAF33 TaxID=3233015 RepID=UPI003F90133A
MRHRAGTTAPGGRRSSRRRRTAREPPIEEVAAVAQRLAVLLSAGVSPVSAWTYLVPELADDVPERPGESAAAGYPGEHAAAPAESSTVTVIRAAASAGSLGDSIADAVAREAARFDGQVCRAWLGLAAAWRVATGAGAPLAESLRTLAASFRDLGQLERDLHVALAGPAATARLVMGLPVIGIVFGGLMGFNTLQTLFATVPGLVCLAGGVTLMLAGQRWNQRLIRAARLTDAAPGLELDLTAIGMAGGGSIDRARSLVDDTAERYGLDRSNSERLIRPVLTLSTRAGVPAAELLRSEAEQVRRATRSEGQRRAATLSVTLMIPLAVCVLPAFMLLGVVPLLISVLSSTVATL